MAEYIERFDVAAFFEKSKQTMWHKDDIVATISSNKNIPTADVVKVKHGEWIENEDDFWVTCSSCGTARYDDETEAIDMFKYCPYCGAKMDLKEGATDTNVGGKLKEGAEE